MSNKLAKVLSSLTKVSSEKLDEVMAAREQKDTSTVPEGNVLVATTAVG